LVFFVDNGSLKDYYVRTVSKQEQRPMTFDTNAQIIATQTWEPAQVASPQDSLAQRCQQVIDNIKGAMTDYRLLSVGCSYGKDSMMTLLLTVEAARQIKADTGVSPAVRAVTADTGVEIPAQTMLAKTMSDRVADYAREEGLDFDQLWVSPDAASAYLVTMIGMRGVASMPGSSNTCSVQLKLDPAHKMKRKLAKEVGGAEYILNFSGVRLSESTERAENIKARRERADKPVAQDDGSGLMAPIMHFTTEDVWKFLNTGPKTKGFETINTDPLISFYEAMSEETCGTEFLTASTTKAQSKSPCGSARGGCFICQKVTDDSAMNNLLRTYPHYEPLARLSRTIRAGHYVPENRNFISKATDETGKIRVFSNAYSGLWTRKLAQWVMTIDIREDEYAATQWAKLDAMPEGAAKSMKREKLSAFEGRRFPRLLTDEQLFMIGFQWARYGIQRVGEMPRIREALMQGQRWELPTDDELAALQARSDRKLMGKTFGYLDSGFSDEGLAVDAYRDSVRDLIGTESPCSPSLMLDDNGDRAMYVSKKGLAHDTMAVADAVEADLSDLHEIEREDFWFWYAIDFADTSRNATHNAELGFLVREGIIRARPGYQSHLAQYQNYNMHLTALREKGSINSLAEILAHPDFISADAAADQKAQTQSVSAAPAMLIATDAKPRAEKAQITETQLDLFAA
jgi:DNA sulfur modification protein DndC